MAGKSVPKVKQKLDKKDLALSLAFLLKAILITVTPAIFPVFANIVFFFFFFSGNFNNCYFCHLPCF